MNKMGPHTSRRQLIAVIGGRCRSKADNLRPGTVEAGRVTPCAQKQQRLSVTFVHPTQATKIYGYMFLRQLVPWPSVDIQVIFLQRLFQGNSSVGGVKHKRGSRI